MFIERDIESFQQLQAYVEKISDIEIKTVNADLEQSVDAIKEFVRQDAQTFPFIFIDPKGWSGFALDVIRPLLNIQPCEVLINFMTQHIVRFINNEASQESFERLFGSPSFRQKLAGTKKEDRVDAAVFEYRNAVSLAGSFEFPGIAAILNPNKDRSHFHLIYLSRSPKGLEVFKGAEMKSMEDMETARAKAELKSRESRTGQRELFGAEDAPESEYFSALRKRYLTFAIKDVGQLIREMGVIDYDEAWKAWLRFPLVWEADLKRWIAEMGIPVHGLLSGERVPKRTKGHKLGTKIS